MGENKEGQTEIEKLCSEVYRAIQEGTSKPSFSRIEDKLIWLILEQRYHNLSEFTRKQCKKYHSNDSKELLELWFRYNDLKEIQFIGTDLYANAIFVKHKVPYLYRSIGKDEMHRVQEEKAKANEMGVGERIFQACLEQIESGKNGNLYSYSKCFGKMLFKYANSLYWSNRNTKIEIRKDAYVNAVSEDGYHSEKSLQKYIREAKADVGGTETERELPFFAVDMSNARDDSVKNLKCWLDGFLGKQKYTTRFNDIFDPIGDAEVVTNFTGSGSGQSVLCSGVERFELSTKAFCVLLYRYFSKYKQECSIRWYHGMDDCDEKAKTEMGKFESFIRKSVDTIQVSEIKEFCESVLKQSISNADDCMLQKIMENIDWEREIFYMRRVKSEKGSADGEIAPMHIYKSDDITSETKLWKDILFAAVEGKYLYIDYLGPRQE